MIPYYGNHYAKQYIKGKPITHNLANLKICATGAIRKNRTERGPFVNKKEWNAKPGDAYEFMASEKWKNSKVVTMASNFSKNNVVKTLGGLEIPKPKSRLINQELLLPVIKEWVDKMDNLVATKYFTICSDL